MPRVLFITKQRSYPGGYGGGLSSGLYNSVRFMVEMLLDQGIEAKIVDVIDNNSIDREVRAYRPTHVFIEAIWVVPEKFEILTKLHPTVLWNIRIHSNTPFLASEGSAFGWILDHFKHSPNVHISANAVEMYKTIRFLLKERYSAGYVDSHTAYLPNHYTLTPGFDQTHPFAFAGPLHEYVDVGCFGAVRPLKNQVLQAVAALKFADSIHKRLRLHINVSRIEGRGEPNLKNLRALFNGQTRHRLVEHGWLPHADFVELVKKMDVGLQVSFTETFNIVAADFADNNVPIVGSREIPWMSRLYMADPNDPDSIVRKLRFALMGAPYDLHALNKVGLCQYDKKSVKLWLSYLS